MPSHGGDWGTSCFFNDCHCLYCNEDDDDEDDDNEDDENEDDDDEDDDNEDGDNDCVLFKAPDQVVLD